MSCNCTSTAQLSPSGEALPLVQDAASFGYPKDVCQSCHQDANCLSSDLSDGTTLPNNWLDSCCYNDNIVILGRKGNKLARFAGSGFIKILNGIASVVESVPLRASTIWHAWWSSGGATPILGEPLPFKYQVIATAQGDFHVIQGTGAADSLSLWDHSLREFTQTPVAQIPHQRTGPIVTGADLQLMGYAPIPADGSPTAVRDETALAGEGLVFLSLKTTVGGACICAPGESAASVAKVVPPPAPTGSETYVLKFNTANGYFWEEA